MMLVSGMPLPTTHSSRPESASPHRKFAAAVVASRRLDSSVSATETTGECLDNIRRIVAATVFRIIQILLLPIGAVSYVVFVIKLVAYSRKTGTSATVLASLYTRYMQHKLGTRWDEACARLMMVMPNVPQLALRLETASTLVAHLLTGYVPRIYRYPYEGVPPMRHQSASRTTF